LARAGLPADARPLTALAGNRQRRKIQHDHPPARNSRQPWRNRGERVTMIINNTKMFYCKEQNYFIYQAV
jgi:hypothetical protein